MLPTPSSQEARRSRCTHWGTFQKRLSEEQMRSKLMMYSFSGLFANFITQRVRLKLDLDSATLTCPVAWVVEVDSKGVRLVVGLPRGWGAVLVVGIGMVIMHIFSRQDGGAGWAAHWRGGESVWKMCAALFHDVPSFVHGLHRAWEATGGKGEKGGGREVVRGDRRVRADSKASNWNERDPGGCKAFKRNEEWDVEHRVKSENINITHEGGKTLWMWEDKTKGGK